MGEVERAEALLQAAGVSGVRVQEQAEMVTMSKAEADELRAGAPGAPAVGAPVAAPSMPSADGGSRMPPPPQLREEAAAAVASGGHTRADLEQMTAHEIAALPQDAVHAAMAKGRRS
jgi:hypothetical protein